tara:strand:+ start:127 stop:312 length:186 start_codon:yes stop_codon:yes gene_type:complete
MLTSVMSREPVSKASVMTAGGVVAVGQLVAEAAVPVVVAVRAEVLLPVKSWLGFAKGSRKR